MVSPQKKLAREAGELSETTKTYLKDIYIKEVFGREKPDVFSGALLKGTMVESDSMDVVKNATGVTYFKNNKHFENEFIKGTPDIVTSEDLVIDIKSNWDMWTFSAVDEKKARSDYFYQILGYMWLTGKSTGELIFCLTNTPEEIMYKEWTKLAWNMDQTEAEKLTRLNHTFDDVPAEMRVKRFQFYFSQLDIDALTGKIIAAREYLKGLSL
jgi:hypothetical protein